MALIVVIGWTVGGYSEDADIDTIQNGFELMVVIVVLIEIIPRFIKKLSPGDVKHFLGLLPTLAILFVISWKFPQINPETLEILAIVLMVLNLLTLRIVKRKLAKRLAAHPPKTVEVEYQPLKHY